MGWGGEGARGPGSEGRDRGPGGVGEGVSGRGGFAVRWSSASRSPAVHSLKERAVLGPPTSRERGRGSGHHRRGYRRGAQSAESFSASRRRGRGPGSPPRPAPSRDLPPPPGRGARPLAGRTPRAAPIGRPP